MIPQRQLVPLRAIAEMLGVHDKTVRKWIAAGRIPAYRVAGHILRLDPQEVTEALLRPTTSTVHPAREAAAARKAAAAPAPMTEAERRARMQASARRRVKRAGG